MSRGTGEGEFLKPFTFRLGPTPWTWTVGSTSLGSGTLRLHLPHSGWPLYSFCSFFQFFSFSFFLLYLISCFCVAYNACTSGFISVCASKQLMKALEPKRLFCYVNAPSSDLWNFLLQYVVLLLNLICVVLFWRRASSQTHLSMHLAIILWLLFKNQQ